MSDHPVRDRGLLVKAAFGIVVALVTAGVLAWPAHAGTAAGDERPGPKAGAAPLLVVEQEAPLLLDEPSTNASSLTADGAQGMDINAPCYVCHVNFKQDPFVQVHSKAHIGCAKCHGESPDHIADEANLTPPNIMYWASKIDISCAGCHTNHNARARDVLARWQERCPDKTNPKQLVCTDCHGDHRLLVRSVVWDKKTGKLLSKAKPVAARSPRAGSPPPAAKVPVAGSSTPPPTEVHTDAAPKLSQ